MKLLRKLLSEKFNMLRLAEIVDELGVEIGSSTLSPYDLAGAIIRGTPGRKFSELIAIVLGEGPIQPRLRRDLLSDEKRLRELCQDADPESDPTEESEFNGDGPSSTAAHQVTKKTWQAAAQMGPGQHDVPSEMIGKKQETSSGVKKTMQKEFGVTDVVIVCALHKPELEKVKFAGGAKWEPLPAHYTDPHSYFRTTYTTKKGSKLNVVASAPTQMGLSASAVLATKMILRFQPKLVAMVGIAAGASGDKQGYGNILAADTTFDYGSGKVMDNKGVVEFQPDPMPLPIDARLKSRLKIWESHRTELDEIYESWPAEKPQTVLNLHVGSLGSGASVIDDPQVVSDIMTHWRKLIGIEMEAYAVHRACHDTVSPEPKFLCLKSICDFAHKKADSWQHYAAYTAAEFCYRFLTQEWENLFPDETQQGD
ncbi:hypothetical protein [Archangium sp. Cb G35]|uniref:5'-methylthioadenosine/S-adenosylhomocysteine nucleosidase family protein n=1 Tax=Archangium sp. Cb G35 TaxID=1920190 RepID=UPI000A60F1D0|nr:hypothetical protein [Archangium sp. Cb G35]